jgi:hypothetical protein
MTGTEVARPNRKPIKFDKLPEVVSKFIDVPSWANSILHGDAYEEPDPDFISRLLAAQAIFAETTEEAFAAAGVNRLQDTLPDTPGAVIGPFEIIDLYVAKSDYTTGNAAFVLLTVVMLDSGEEFKYSTGATGIQASLIGLLRLGTWPIRAKFKRGDSKDRGGHYLMHLMPPD